MVFKTFWGTKQEYYTGHCKHTKFKGLRETDLLSRFIMKYQCFPTEVRKTH